MVIRSEGSLTRNEWHSIQVKRSGRNGDLRVDNGPLMQGRALGQFSFLTVESNLYFGAAPIAPSLPLELRTLPSFTGCVRQFRSSEFSSPPVSLISDALFGRGVMECPVLDVCSSITCSNGGTCTNTLDGFLCQCSSGFTGVRCEIDICATNNTCLNNGGCYVERQEGVDVIRCNCSAPFTGSNCNQSK